MEECIRHNVEIRKIRKYLQTKKKKNEFEKLLLASAGPYLEQGERAAAEMKASSYEKLRHYYGAERIVPIYVEVEDGMRLARALDRERSQIKPNYDEMCRRFLADSADFSEENLEKAGIKKRFQNEELQKCVEKITEFIFQSK